MLGVAALALLLALSYRALNPVRRLAAGSKAKLFSLIAAAAASHLLLDALNSYGVHPFYPFDNTWYFGDAVFIFEPWLWVLLGIAAAWNAAQPPRARRRCAAHRDLSDRDARDGDDPNRGCRVTAGGRPPVHMDRRSSSTRTRAGVALAASALVIATLISTSRIARATALEALQPETRGRLVDMVLTPNPASPLCWAVIGIELDEAGGVHVLWSGTLSVAPQWKAPTACASYRFGTIPSPLASWGRGSLALRRELRQPLEPLRRLARQDCWTRSWLQFGRAPVLTGEAIFDLRFAQRFGQNFTVMPVGRQAGRSGCPPFLTNWSLPRADLLE